MAGELETTQAGIDYSGGKVTLAAAHKIDVDPIEDGCIAGLSLRVELVTGGCALELKFGAASGAWGGLVSATLHADSFCPGFTDDHEGVYTSEPGYGPWWPAGPSNVNVRTAASVCLSSVTLTFPDQPLYLLEGEKALLINLRGLSLTGTMLSLADPSLRCVNRTCATGYRDGGDGWCVLEGTCSEGHHEGGGSQCTPVGTCAPGYRDDGTGTCATDCAEGFHDGGDGKCVPIGICSPGFHEGGGTACTPAGTCASGYHDDGLGICVEAGCASGFDDGGGGQCTPTGTCSDGYHNSGSGTCVSVGTCSEGFHDDGTGSCIAVGCAVGFHDDGLGACTAAGTCGPGYNDGGNGVCVPVGECSPGFHPGGNGACVAQGICSAGFHYGGAGTCVADGECSAGFHNGGTGECLHVGICAAGHHYGGEQTCVLQGTCSTGYHDGGSGTCVAVGTCSVGFHDDGTGGCAHLDCAVGYHDGGNGTCVKAMTCSAGYHDGGDTTCVPEGKCLVDFHDDGSGICVAEGCAPTHHDGGDGVCVPEGMCSALFHNDGTGACVSAACASGYHDGGDGICVASGTCSSGYHDGGSGDCLAAGTCSPVYQDDGTGVCVLSGCAQGFHNGGDGSCVPAGSCAVGFHDGASGGCISDLFWSLRAGGSDPEDGGGVTTAADGSVTVVGGFQGTTTFGTTTLSSLGSLDLFVARWDSVGSLLWAKRAGGAYDDIARDVESMADGGVVVVGPCGPAVFGPGEAKETTLNMHMFVARYAPSGALMWVTGATTGDAAAVAVSAADSIFVTGNISTTATFGEGEAGETTLVAEGSGGSYDAFLAKYEASGELAWVRRVGGADTQRGYGVTTTPDDGAVITGDAWGTSLFAPGEAGQKSVTSAGSADIFVARYGASGNLVWARDDGGSDWDNGLDLAVAPDGSVVVAGQFRGSPVFGGGSEPQTDFVSAGSTDIFVAGYSQDGDYLWAKQAGGVGMDRAQGIASTPDGILVAGDFSESAVFGPAESGEKTLTAWGKHNGFIAMLKEDGTLSRVTHISSVGELHATDITYSPSGDVAFSTGYFGDSITYAGTTGPVTQTSAGGFDVWVAKYRP